jgi:Flp pilus assembly protein TadG
MMRRLLLCHKGTALIELALVLPIVLTLLVGTVELSRYAIILMKLDKTANAMADFVTQGRTVRTADLNGFAASVPQIMRPFGFSGSVVFTSAARNQGSYRPCANNNVQCIVWQNRPVGTDASRLGAPGANAVLPGAYQIKPRQDVIAAEVFYNYRPLLLVTGTLISSLAPQKLYRVSISKSRYTNLTTLSP